MLNFERADIREVIHSLATALGHQLHDRPAHRGPGDDPHHRQDLAQGSLPALQPDPAQERHRRRAARATSTRSCPVAEGEDARHHPARRGAPAIARATTTSSSRSSRCDTSRRTRWRTSSSRSSRRAATCSSYPRANAVVVTDLDSNVQRLRQLAATFDIDGFRNLHARVFKMREGDPDELANELLDAPRAVRRHRDRRGRGRRLHGAAVASRTRSSRSRSIRPPSTRSTRWLAMLDIPPDQGAGRQTFVYNVENAKAADLAAVLNELFGGGERWRRRRPRSPPRGQPGGVGLFGAGGAAGAGRGGAGGRGGVGGVGAGGGAAGTGVRRGGLTGGGGADGARRHHRRDRTSGGSAGFGSGVRVAARRRRRRQRRRSAVAGRRTDGPGARPRQRRRWRCRRRPGQPGRHAPASRCRAGPAPGARAGRDEPWARLPDASPGECASSPTR